VYVTGLDIDSDRLSDASYVGKTHIRERGTNPDGTYNQTQGKNYTVERLMPTPFKLTMKVDIWAANTDQKLQIMEQILVLFNPSLELQTSDNFVDWTALTVLNLAQINWSSRTVPVGTDSPIDIASLTLNTPIWISPPVKVKHLGVITKIITSLWSSTANDASGYIEGLGADLGGGSPSFSDLLSEDAVTVTGFNVELYNIRNTFRVRIIDNTGDAAVEQDWQQVFARYPGKFTPGSSKMYIKQVDGFEISGTLAYDLVDPTLLSLVPDQDLLTRDETALTTNQFSNYTSCRLGTSTFDAIINPMRIYPGTGMYDLTVGDRFLIIEDIGDTSANDQAVSAWGGLTANANDIIEYDGTEWHVLFDSVNFSKYEESIVIQSNIYDGNRVQYLWNNVSWVKRFDGEYGAKQWQIVL
jgi:hypothetical protein